MRMVFEDAGLEEFAMSGESCIAVPIQVSENAEGEVTVTVYSRFAESAQEFSRTFCDDPFSDEAKRFLEEGFTSPMAQAGYEYESDFDQTILCFEADEATLARCECDREVVCIDTNEKITKLSFDTVGSFEIDDEDPCDVAFAVVEDGAVLSVSCVNDLSEDGSLEINVETAVGERGKGYASAVVSALCRHLLALGERVSYKCRRTNGASLRVAEKCGLGYAGKSFNFVCYKN